MLIHPHAAHAWSFWFVLTSILLLLRIHQMQLLGLVKKLGPLFVRRKLLVVVIAIKFVPAEGFCTTAIGRIRVCNHDGRTGFPCQNSASDGELLIGKNDSRH
jgi:hypothetical protein